jgi:hypothetical protein
MMMTTTMMSTKTKTTKNSQQRNRIKLFFKKKGASLWVQFVVLSRAVFAISSTPMEMNDMVVG